MKKEKVNHPKHYNNHKSGVEAIEVIRSFSFNLGSAFKYIYRRNDKENCTEDLQKALWYVEDEIEYRKKREVKIFSSFTKFLEIPDLFRYLDWKKRSKLVKTIVDNEPDENCRNIFRSLNDCDYFIYEIVDLYRLRSSINNLIAENKKEKHGK